MIAMENTMSAAQVAKIFAATVKTVQR